MSVSPGPDTGDLPGEAPSTPAASPPSPLGRLRTRTRAVTGWYHRHPTWADAVLAVAVLAGNILITHLITQADSEVLPLATTVTRFPLIVPAWLACTACLTTRRRYPAGSWLALTLILLLHNQVLERLHSSALDDSVAVLDPFGLFFTLGLPVALGTVALHCRPRLAWTAWVTTSAAYVLAYYLLNGLPAKDPEVLASTMIATLLFLTATLVGLNLRSARARLSEAEIRSSRQALAREQSALLAASNERSRIAREMHDVVAHSLAVMITMADGAAATIDRDPATAKQALTMLAESGRTALADTRRLVGVLREDPALSQEQRREDGFQAPGASTGASAPSPASACEDAAGPPGTPGPASTTAPAPASPQDAGGDALLPEDGHAGGTRRMRGRDASRPSSPSVRDLPLPEFAPPGTVAAVEPSAMVASLRREATSEGSDSSTGATPLAPAPEQEDIATLVNRFQAAGVPVTYTWSGRALPEDKGLQLTVFRITQEALTNILRYAPTSAQVTVAVERHTGAVVLTVDNDAAPGSRPMHGSGKGLIGMRERAAVYGGTVQAGPTAAGWRVRAVLRWEETEEGTSSWQMPL